MPKKATVETESLWVPLAARCVCYACGVHLPETRMKDNCRLCFDVFCVKCLGTKRLMPTHYGYTEPQSVCVSCNLLLTSFVTFASQMHKRGAGIILPPRQAVIVSACNIPVKQRLPGSESPGGAAASPQGASDGEPEGFFARFKKRFSSQKGGSVEESSAIGSGSRNGLSAPASSSSLASTHSSLTPPVTSHCNIPPSALTSRGMKIRDAGWLFMVGWRPLNPDTSIVFGSQGEVYLRLRDVTRVTLGASAICSATEPASHNTGGSASNRNTLPPSASVAAKRLSMAPSALQREAEEVGFNDGRITIEMRGGYYCQLLVGVVQVERGPPSGSPGSDDEDQSDDDEPRIVDFTSDPSAAQDLVERLQTLIRHCRTHFAFSNASMALHVDLCPA